MIVDKIPSATVFRNNLTIQMKFCLIYGVSKKEFVVLTDFVPLSILLIPYLSLS